MACAENFHPLLVSPVTRCRKGQRQKIFPTGRIAKFSVLFIFFVHNVWVGSSMLFILDHTKRSFSVMVPGTSRS